MTTFDPGPAAAALLAARRERVPAGPLPPSIAPRDLTEAAAAQFALAELLGQARPGGFKIGATGNRMQALLGLSGPAAGFMAAPDIFRGSATWPIAALRGAAIECEIAVVLGRDLPPGPCSLEQAADAVEGVAAAIELVENRYGPPPIGDLEAVGTPTLVADQVYHVAAIVAAPVTDWRRLDLAALTGIASIDGIERDRGQGAELLGHPLRGLAWLAGSEVAAAFDGLYAGQTVMLGSVIPSVWLDAPCEVRVSFEGWARQACG